MISVWVDEYIASKKNAWARTSQKNERLRLRKHAHAVMESPDVVYERLKLTMKAHSIKTTFVRLGQFFDWLIEADKMPPAKNPWKAFLKTNAMIFKHCYQIERVKVTFDEANVLIQSVEMPYRLAALQLLEGGLRYCELRTFDGDKVIGKGSKPRKVFLRDELKAFRYTGSYSALFVRLRAVGLKPHTLRKLCATEISRDPRAKDQDICKLFGWSSIETSIKYRQPLNDERLGEMIQSVVSRAKVETKIKSFIAKLVAKVNV